MTSASTSTLHKRAWRLPFVMEASGLSRATIYRLAAEGKFPRPFKLAERASAWDADAVEQWLIDRMARVLK